MKKAIAIAIVTSTLLWPMAQSSSSLWNSIKRALTADDGRRYFENYVKDSMIPGGAQGVHAFVGTVLSTGPADRPTILVVALGDKTTPDATLHLSAAWSSKIGLGSEVEFQGVPTAFSEKPFMVSFNVDINDIALVK
jgi:hypothetical protein